MSAIGNLIGDTRTMGKHIFNIFLIVIVLFVAKHFLSDFGLKLYKMYYGIEGMAPMLIDATSCSGSDCEIEGQFCPKGVPGASAGNFLCKDKKWVKVAGRQATVAIQAPAAIQTPTAIQAVAQAPAGTISDKVVTQPVQKPWQNANEYCIYTTKDERSYCKNKTTCHGYDNIGCTENDLKLSDTVITPAPPQAAPAQAAQASAATDEGKVADAATQASQMHSDAQNATNVSAVVPGAAIGSWGGNNDSGFPEDSIASQAASSNLATQQIIPGTAYPSNTTVANVSGVYPNQASLNNIQGGNAQQTMTGVNTDMAPSPLAPTSSESVSKANDAISKNITGRDEQDAAIDISIKMKMSEHVAKNLVGNIPQYTNPQQYASGRTTGLNNNSYNPSYQSMPQDSLGATYDNRLGGNYPSYSYNTQNNRGTAYTDQYKPANPGKKPKPYNSLMDLFR